MQQLLVPIQQHSTFLIEKNDCLWITQFFFQEKTFDFICEPKTIWRGYFESDKIKFAPNVFDSIKI